MDQHQEFDFKVHHRNEKGRLSKITPYRAHITVNFGKLFERPVDPGDRDWETTLT